MTIVANTAATIQVPTPSGPARARSGGYSADENSSTTPPDALNAPCPEDGGPQGAAPDPEPAEERPDGRGSDDHQADPEQVRTIEVVAQQDDRAVPDVPDHTGDQYGRPVPERPERRLQEPAPPDFLPECEHPVRHRSDRDRHDLHEHEQTDRRDVPRFLGKHRGVPAERVEVEANETQECGDGDAGEDDEREQDDRAEREAHQPSDRSHRYDPEPPERLTHGNTLLQQHHDRRCSAGCEHHRRQNPQRVCRRQACRIDPEGGGRRATREHKPGP
nr:hypothetical protein [Curtobacterium pusillum]